MHPRSPSAIPNPQNSSQLKRAIKICRFLVLFVSLCLSVGRPASSQVTAPRLGLVRYADGGIYPLYGVSGNYVVGPKLLDAADGLSFSQAGGLLVRQGVLMLVDSSLQTVSSFNAEGDKPQVAIGKDLDSAIAWLPVHRLLVYSNGTTLQSVAVPGSAWTGTVVGLEKISSDVASLLVLNSPGSSVEEAKISLSTGAVLSLSNVAETTGPVYRQADTLIFLQSSKLIITSMGTGAVRSLAIHAQDLTFERLSSNAIHLHSPSSGRDWLLHTSGEKSGDGPGLYELPSPPSGAAQ